MSSPDTLWRDIRSRHPRLRQALAADVRMTAARYRGESNDLGSWPALVLAGLRLPG